MSIKRKGIILAGGYGTRLRPLTKGISKQILPVYDKPLIYYPLSTLMLGGIREILIITTKDDHETFKNLLGDGKSLGINLTYKIQAIPEGVAKALLIAENFIKNSPSALILGDNIFYGNELVNILRKADLKKDCATVFTYPVSDPENYGVIEFDERSKPLRIVEKSSQFLSRFAITGLYYYDSNAIEKAKQIKPSIRGEYEISSLNQIYLDEHKLNIEKLGRGLAWLDAGTIDSLIEAGIYIRSIEHRQGLKIGCPEEIAWRFGWINDNNLEDLAHPLKKSGYGDYLLKLLEEENLNDKYEITY
tara:strand:+ start:790 stop:1701 length:912 start_codon:yes stop_codon:yes gene_type:complete